MSNFKVKNRFEKELKNWEGRISSYDLEHIRHLMQDMYDLGHADGYAEAIHQYNELEEVNGNL